MKLIVACGSEQKITNIVTNTVTNTGTNTGTNTVTNTVTNTITNTVSPPCTSFTTGRPRTVADP